MSAAHVCDECKNVAPLDDAIGWWHVSAMSSHGVTALSMVEKSEYEFCSWGCLEATAARLSRVRNTA